MTRINPANRTGTGGEDLLSKNFNWNFPLVGLKGRGLDLGLTLSYNSLVWIRSGNSVEYDIDEGSIAPGFRLGFPTVEGPFWNDQAGTYFYLLVTPSGGRVELRYAGSNAYEAKDSSYLQLLDNGSSLLVRSTDGTQMSFGIASGTWRCNQIKDRNGNYQTITYNSEADIATITDTLGRVLTFNYDPYWNLQSITQAGRAQPWATFGWGTASIGNNFPGLTNYGPNSTSIPVLTQVGLPDGSAYQFYYNTYGQVMKVARAASDGWHHSYSFYDFSYPGDDCPRITQRRDWATNWSDQQGVPHEVSTYFSQDGDGGCRMTMPDGTVYKEYYGSSWQSGLTTETRRYASVADANANVWQKRTTVAWTQDNTSVSYLTNPRVTETNVYDGSGNRRRSAVEYISYGLPSQVTEYAADAATVLRRTTTTYFWDSVYINKRIIGLPREIQVYDANNQPVSKTWFDYDWGGDYWAALPASAVQHDASGDHTGRGLLCWIGKWDTLDANNFDKTQRFHFRYNRTGSLIRSSDPLWHETNISYSDSFSDGVNRNTFAYPTTLTDADGFSSAVKYHFESGVVTRTQGPPPAGQSQGAVQTMLYDDAGRITRVTTENNGAYTRYLYGADYFETLSSVNNVADEAFTFQLLNGRGQVFISGGNHPGSSTGYRAQVTYYDVMGRVMKRSNPAEINGSWVPAGDDVIGWIYPPAAEYDWQGRLRKSYNQDGTYKEASYNGCGCAGGEIVTLTDEMSRRQKVYSDVLGRTWKTEILNWNGSVYSTTTNTFNARDQVTLVRQWAGGENGGGAYQDTTMNYDGYGRLQSKHVPQQNAGTATVYAYNADDTIQTVTDARGASATYGYNSRHLITSINYSAPSGIPATPDVAFGYDAAGNRTSMSDGVGTTTYHYDQLSRMDWEERTFNGLSGTYRLSYGYNLAGQLTSLAEPSQFGATVNYVYDNAGRLGSVSATGMQVSSLMTGLQYRAWGALKHADYGDGTNLNLSYNNRLLMTRYELNNVYYTAWPPAYVTMGSQNQYHADGRVQYTQDLQDGRFDRGYTFDHAGRLEVATSGREARGEPPANPPDSPYKQTFNYDVWGNMGRTGRLWSQGQGDNPTYANNRRSDWAYDAQGHAVGGGWAPFRTHAYDAAGQQVNTYEESWSGQGEFWTFHQNTIEQVYSSGSQPGKRVETRHSEDYQGTITNDVRTVHYLRSSVLGGVVIAELDQWGGREGHVYAGGQKIADYQGWVPYGTMDFRHANPANGNWINVHLPGNGGTRTEFDPLGATVGIFDPFPSQMSYNDMMWNEFLYSELGNPFDLGGGCGTLDGMPVSCSELNMRMEAGTVAVESLFRAPQSRPGDDRPRFGRSGGSIIWEIGWQRETHIIRSLGIGLFEVDSPRWIPDNEGGRLGLRTDIVRYHHAQRKSACGQFVDELLRFSRGSVRQRFIGQELAFWGSQVLPEQAPELPVDGFQEKYISGGQNGWAMVHIATVAGFTLIGKEKILNLPGAPTGYQLAQKMLENDTAELQKGLDWKAQGRTTVPGLYGNRSNYPLDHYIQEKHAERWDDGAGSEVGHIIERLHGRQVTRDQARSEIFNLLCDK